MTDLCLEFGISRKTGHKIWSGFRGSGWWGLRTSRERRSGYHTKTEPEIEKRLNEMRSLHPTWGGRKARQCCASTSQGSGGRRQARSPNIYGGRFA